MILIQIALFVKCHWSACLCKNRGNNNIEPSPLILIMLILVNFFVIHVSALKSGKQAKQIIARKNLQFFNHAAMIYNLHVSFLFTIDYN